MALDRSYFRGSLALPQLATQSAPVTGLASLATQITGENTLEWFITRYEDEFLHKMLGHRLYEAYLNGISSDEPLQIWLDLRDRIYIQKNGFGFSPAANYVYFYAMQTAASQNSMSGEVRHKPDFAEAIIHKRKMVLAWNDMVDAIQHIREWIWIHRKELHDAMPEIQDAPIATSQEVNIPRCCGWPVFFVWNFPCFGKAFEFRYENFAGL